MGPCAAWVYAILVNQPCGRVAFRPVTVTRGCSLLALRSSFVLPSCLLLHSRLIQLFTTLIHLHPDRKKLLLIILATILRLATPTGTLSSNGCLLHRTSCAGQGGRGRG